MVKKGTRWSLFRRQYNPDGFGFSSVHITSMTIALCGTFHFMQQVAALLRRVTESVTVADLLRNWRNEEFREMEEAGSRTH
jgi:DNA-binding IscR family transcriptional regulator